jgi:S1-C subfamily serine protease
MAQTHPYAAALAEKIRRRKNQQLKLTARALIRGFGYERRTEKILNEIASHLLVYDMTATLSLTSPRDLDEKITISPTKPLSPPTLTPHDMPSSLVQQDLRHVAARAVPATVAITTDASIGSGFVVHPDGLVVTARHVIDEGGYSPRSVQVTLCPGTPNEQIVEGIVFRSHRQLDYALLWLMADGPFQHLSIGDPQALQHAQTVLAVGCPSGLYNTVSMGIISNPRQPHGRIEYIQTDAAIDPGNSGGPLISEDGVVGINEWILVNVGAAKFALPIDYVTDDINAAIAYGRDRCVTALYCPACGATDYAQPTWFCRSCGVQFAPAEPAGAPA